MSETLAPRVLIVEHATYCPAARMGRWLAEAGCQLQVVRGHLGESLPPNLENVDALLVMGGPMSAYDDASYPWLGPTKALLAEAINCDLPTLGICLGHQLLAVAGGGQVRMSATGQQLGLVPVGLTDRGAKDPLFAELPVNSLAVHWNDDLVSRLPDTAVTLANSAAGLQAFRLGQHVFGVQFHPEVDVEIVRGWADQDVAAGRLTPSIVGPQLGQIAAADSVLDRTWSEFGYRFAAIARTVLGAG